MFLFIDYLMKSYFSFSRDRANDLKYFWYMLASSRRRSKIGFLKVWFQSMYMFFVFDKIRLCSLIYIIKVRKYKSGYIMPLFKYIWLRYLSKKNKQNWKVRGGTVIGWIILDNNYPKKKLYKEKAVTTVKRANYAKL